MIGKGIRRTNDNLGDLSRKVFGLIISAVVGFLALRVDNLGIIPDWGNELSYVFTLE